MADVDRVRRLLKAYKHREAEQLLTLLRAESPNDPELAAELGLLYCYTQREFDAVKLLDAVKGSEREAELRQILTDYFYCRRLMADKLGVADADAAAIGRTFTEAPSEQAGIKLSACLIVKNEHNHLERCLNSLKGVCDEVVVVDTGSTDDTVEIAERMGARLGSFEWCDDFAAARNVSLDLATGNWVLWIDADEELTADSANSIREAIIRPHFAGFYIRIVNFMGDDGDANQYVHTPVRLFRHIPEIRFAGRIHEQVLQSFDENGFVAATLANATINHYGYRTAVMEEKDKIARTISMLEKEVREHPRDPFHWFNLANAYSVARRAEDAERSARLCLNYIPDDAPYGPVAYQILTSALIALNKTDEALQECDVCEMKGFGTILNEFDRAHSLLKLERFSEALRAIDRCLAMDWPHDLTGDYGIKTYKGAVLRSQILSRLGRFEEALELAEGAVEADPKFGLAYLAKGFALTGLGRPQSAYAAYLEAAKYPGLSSVRRLAAREAVQFGNFAEATCLYAEILEAEPQDTEAAAGFIRACESAGDQRALLEGYEWLLSHGHRTPEVLTNRGRALADSGQYQAALESFVGAIEMDSRYANGYFNCGDLLYRMGNFQEAAEIYEAGLRQQPLHAEGWFVLGNCFAQIGHHSGADIAYGQAWAIDPDHRGAHANRRLLLSEAAA